MLRVVHGPFPDLEPAFVDALRRAASGKRPVLVAAPSRRLADRLQRLAARAGLASLGVSFHTFYSLAWELVEEAGGLDGTLIGDPVFHDAVVDGLIDGAGDLFGGAERPKALAAAVRSSLRDLIDAGVSPEQVAELGPELVSDAERARLKALLALSLAYQRKLEELGVVSPSALTRAAARLAESSPALERYGEALYYGFYDLTGLQSEFFSAVAARLPATLYFPYEKGHPAFRYADAFFEQTLAARSPQKAPRADGRRAAAPALERLFGGQAPASLPPGALELVSASGARDEAWAAAKRILALVEEEGFAYDEIGVVARSLEPYRGALEEVFGENSIPLDLAAGEPLLRRPAAKLAWTLLSLKRRDFPALAVLDILGSPYCARRPAAKTVSAWRLAARRLGIRAGWLQWRKLEARAATGVTLEEPGEEPRILVSPADCAALWDAVASWQSRLSKPAQSWQALAEDAQALLDAELALPDDASPRERETFEAVAAAIADLREFDRLGLPPSRDAFLEALERKLRSLTLETAAGGRGVRALGAMDARGESFRAVLLLGLKEKSFPRQIQEDPILREETRAALRHPAGYWIRPKRDGYEEERLLFYLCAEAARDKLVCVFPRSDESGKAEVPSLYLRELCRAAGTELSAARRVPRLPFEKLESVPASYLCPREASLRLAVRGGDAAAYGRAVGLPGQALEACLAMLPELSRAGAPGRLDGVIEPPKAFLEALAERGVSPTALDELASCPFRFFAHRLLGLGGVEEPSSQGEIAPWVRGKVYHEALELFYGSLAEPMWSGGAWRPALSAALETVFASRGWRELGVYPVLWRAERRRVEQALESFLAWDLAQLQARGLRPRWREKELKGAVPGGLLVRGVVDRVDADPEGRRLRVIDYKTSWKKPRKLAALVRDGEHHQLPLYAALVAEGGGAVEEAAILALEDSPETTGRERSHVLAAKELAQAQQGFYEGLARRLEALTQGRLPIMPEDGEHGKCAYCDFPTLCRKSHPPTRARARAKEGRP